MVMYFSCRVLELEAQILNFDVVLVSRIKFPGLVIGAELESFRILKFIVVDLNVLLYDA